MSKSWKSTLKAVDTELDADCARRFAIAIDRVWDAISSGLGILKEQEKVLIADAAQMLGLRLMSRALFYMGDWEAMLKDLKKLMDESEFAKRVKMNLDHLRRS